MEATEPKTYMELRREQIDETSRNLEESFAKQREASKAQEDALREYVDRLFGND